MTRPTMVLLTGLVALLFFCGVVLLYGYGGNPVQPVATVQDDALVRTHSPIIGSTDAPVTIVEFFDPS